MAGNDKILASIPILIDSVQYNASFSIAILGALWIVAQKQKRNDIHSQTFSLVSAFSALINLYLAIDLNSELAIEATKVNPLPLNDQTQNSINDMWYLLLVSVSCLGLSIALCYQRVIGDN